MNVPSQSPGRKVCVAAPRVYLNGVSWTSDDTKVGTTFDLSSTGKPNTFDLQSFGTFIIARMACLTVQDARTSFTKSVINELILEENDAKVKETEVFTWPLRQ